MNDDLLTTAKAAKRRDYLMIGVLLLILVALVFDIFQSRWQFTQGFKGQPLYGDRWTGRVWESKLIRPPTQAPATTPPEPVKPDT